MHKLNVGLSRKLSHGYNSNGYSINLEREIAVSPEDKEATLQAIQDLFRLAEDALAHEIDRDERHTPRPDTSQKEVRSPRSQFPRTVNEGNGSTDRQESPATRKQVQFLFLLARRHGLSRSELEEKIEQTLGKRITVNRLGKREAGQVIDVLNQAPPHGRPD